MPLALNIFNNEIQTALPDYTSVNIVLSSEAQTLADSTFNSAVLSSKNFTQGNFLPLSGGSLTGLLSASQGLTVNNISTFTGIITSFSGGATFSQSPVSFGSGYAVFGNGPSFAVNRGKAFQEDSVAVNFGSTRGLGSGSVALHSGTVLTGSSNLALNAGYAFGFNSIASGLSYSGANYSVAFGDDCFAAGNACFVAGRKTNAGTPVNYNLALPAGGGTWSFYLNSAFLVGLPPLIKVVSLTDQFGNELVPPYEAIIQNPSYISPTIVRGELLRGSIATAGAGYIILPGSTGLGNNAIAFGQSSSAFGEDSFVTGYFTIASGARSNAHGAYSKALNEQAYATGNRTLALGLNSIASGLTARALGDQSHAEGNGSIALGLNSHSEGYQTFAIGDQSHSEGYQTRAQGLNSFAGGYRNVSTGDQSFTFGDACSATNIDAVAMGYSSKATGNTSIALGYLANSIHDFSVVISANPGGGTTSTRANQFSVAAPFGIYLQPCVGINTDSLDNALTVNGTISGNSGITNTTFTGDTFITNANNVNLQTGASYTVQASDNGKLITLNNSSSVSVFIPSGLPVGFSASFIQLGTGQVTFLPTGLASLLSDGSKSKIATQYSMATVVSPSTNVFVLAGNISV